MKKFIAMLLALVMVMSMAACASNNGGETTTAATTTAPQVDAPASALEILNTVWGAYADDQKFASMGGTPQVDAEGFPILNEGPGAVETTDTDTLTYTLLIPADLQASITDAASLVHMMNANTFTCGVYRLAAGTDVDAFATTMRDTVQSNQWFCGFPEQLIITVIGGEYVLVAFGNGEIMNTFNGHLTAGYPDAVSKYAEAIG